MLFHTFTDTLPVTAPTLTVDELSRVKRDLEAALKDVLQAVKVSQEGASPPDASLDALASVSTRFLLCHTVFSRRGGARG